MRHGNGSLHHLLCIHRLLHAVTHCNLVYLGEVLSMQAHQIRTESVAALCIHTLGEFPVRRQNDQKTEFGKFLDANGKRMTGIMTDRDVVGRIVKNGWGHNSFSLRNYPSDRLLSRA